jgi:hypothetical protein
MKYRLRHIAGPCLVIGVGVGAWRHEPFQIALCAFLLLGNYLFHWTPNGERI